MSTKIYIDLERLLAEKQVSKNKVVRIDLSILARLCEYLNCTPNDILKITQSNE